MTDIDYSTVTADQLEMKREPRKSKFTVVHKPTGTVAENPVAPGDRADVRFRRPGGMPKENRPKNMTGYVESRPDEGSGLIFPIIETEADGTTTVKNDYLEKLAGDAEALKLSFEGRPEPEPSAEAPAAETTGGEDSPADPAAEVAPTPDAPEPEQAEVSSEGEGQLDELLASIGDE